MHALVGEHDVVHTGLFGRVPRLLFVIGREGFVNGGFGLSFHVLDRLIGRVEAVQLARLYHEHHLVIIGAEGRVNRSPVLLALVPGVGFLALGGLATEENGFVEFDPREFFRVLTHLLDELGHSCTCIDDVHTLAKVLVIYLVGEDEHGSTILPPEQLHVLRSDVFIHVGLVLAVMLRTLGLCEVLHKHLMPIVVRSELRPAECIPCKANEGGDLLSSSVFLALDILVDVGSARNDEEVVLAALWQFKKGRIHNLLARLLDIYRVVETQVIPCTREEAVIIGSREERIVAGMSIAE